MRLAIAALALLNFVLLAAWSGLLEPLLGNGREPHRLLRQVRPERLRVAQIGWPARLATVQGPADAAAAAADARKPSSADAPGSDEAAEPAPSGSLPAATGSIPAVEAAWPAASAPPAVAAPSSRTAAPGAVGSPDPTASARPGAPSRRPAAATGPTPGSAVPAGAASACIEWGTFSAAELPHARQVAERTGARAETVRRTPDPKAFMVYLPPAPDQAAAQARVAELRNAGIAAYVLSDGPYRWAVSLGVFRSEQSAQALRQTLQDRGLSDAQVGERGPERWALRLHSAAPLPSDRQQALSADFGGRTLRPCSA